MNSSQVSEFQASALGYSFAFLSAFLALSVFLFLSPVNAAVELPANLVDAGAKVAVVKAGLGLCDSPTVDAEGNLYFLDTTKSHIWKVSAKGGSEKLKVQVDGLQAIAIGKDGKILLAKAKQFAKLESDGKEALLVGGDLLGDIADISVGSNGSLFFSNGAGKALFYRTPEGNRIAHRGIPVAATGLAYLDEKQMLYLAVPANNSVVSYNISTEGFISQTPAEVATVPAPKALTLDEVGNLYVVSSQDKKIHVYQAAAASSSAQAAPSITPTPTTTPVSAGAAMESKVALGKELGSFDLASAGAKGLPTPTNLLFVGKTLYITGDGGLWKLDLKQSGLSR